MDKAALTALWEQRWPGSPPIGHEIEDRGRERWVRFHSLPGSKRYPEDEGEYAILLERHNTVLESLFAGGEVYVMVPRWTGSAEAPAGPPAGAHWRSWLQQDDPDPEFRTYGHVFVERRPWRRGCLDGLLRRVADEEEAGVIVTDTGLRRLYHPYDGGADVHLVSTRERDELRDRHAGWLSGHPGGW
ncbi:hypothetical protein [Kitasatospora sp. NPDC101183]|uniref:DUF3885 domain-containing protein n=1 Tax=Kitasatospora sp. NPDC101183 TaxID=3364100 RepID=UPI00382CDB01